MAETWASGRGGAGGSQLGPLGAFFLPPNLSPCWGAPKPLAWPRAPCRGCGQSAPVSPGLISLPP